jgi:ribosomal protein S18 acetylase RimI-like enzyme
MPLNAPKHLAARRDRHPSTAWRETGCGISVRAPCRLRIVFSEEMVPPFEIRRLELADVEDYRAIRLASLRHDPAAFGALYEVEAARPIDSFAERLASSIVLGAYTDGRLVGVAGFRQETGPKERHKGVVWGVYVQPDARGRGLAASLIAGIIERARPLVEQLTLTVVQGNDAAIALYRRYGFAVYGVEPRARKHLGAYVDKVLMVLDLRPAIPRN